MLRIPLEAITSSLNHLPALQPVIVKLLASFDNPRVDTPSLVNEIAQDQALCVRVLRLANSSFYGLPAHIDSLKDAVMVLGFRTVRAVTVAVSLAETFSAQMIRDFDIPGFWRHSVAVGMATREIAAIVKRPTDIAFTAGVIHDIGLLAMFWLYPAAMQSLIDSCRQTSEPLVNRECEDVGIDHCEVGAALALHWGLPAVLADAILHHEHPEQAVAESLADLVHVANSIVQQYGFPEMKGLASPPVSELAMNRLNLGPAEIRQVVARLDAELEPTYQALFA